MANHQATFVVENLRRMARQQQAQMKPLQKKPRPVAPSEQVRRFLDGEERYRLESGEITPTQWAEYQRRMLQQLGMEVG